MLWDQDVDSLTRESVCCLLVLNAVPSTPQWIRRSRVICMMCLCLHVNMCICPEVLRPFIPRTSLPMPLLALGLSH
jgi:hypothetical protein